MDRARRFATTLALSLASMLALASAAIAADGEGLYGRTDDKVITFFCFGVLIFFTLMVVGLSLLQNRLETRKERVREEIERAGT